MNKKLLVAAIAAGMMIPGLAAADVKIFGTIQAETGNIDIDVSGGGDTDTTYMGGGSGAINGGGSNALGVKGTEKLGNGMSVFFKINQSYSTFNGDVLNARDRFVGVKGDGWHVQAGRMNTRYKSSSVKYDPFLATGLQSRAIGAVSGAHNGYGNDLGEVGFKSGSWSGGFQITWEDATGEGNTAGNTTNSVDAGSWNANIKYAANNWEAGFAYQNLDYDAMGTTAGVACTASALTAGGAITSTPAGCGPVASTAGDSGDSDAWKIHGKYTANALTITAQYETVDTDNTAAGNNPRFDGTSTMSGTIIGAAEEYDSLHIGLTYMMSDSTAIIGRFADTDWEDVGGVAGADVDGTHWAIGAVHFLSKRTHVYGGYMANDYDVSGAGDMDVDAWGIGMRHNF